MKTQITEVQIVPIKPTNGLIAFASVVLDDKLYLSSIGVHAKLDGTGYRLTYPTKKVGTKDIQLFHPINKEVSQAVEQAVFSRIKDVMNQYDRFNNAYDSAS